MTSLETFLQWFKEYYQHENTTLPTDFKNELIEEVIVNNVKYVTKEDVINFHGCIMCGRCCVSQRCPHVTQSGMCSRHDDPIDQLCIDYPWTGDEFGIAPLTLNCRYQVSFFVFILNRFFDEALDDEKYSNLISYLARGGKTE